MKKKELLKLIKKVNEANKVIMNNSRLLSITKFDSLSMPNSKDERMWFPNIPDLKEEFEILKKEVKEAQINIEKQKEIIEEAEKKCNHEIRLEYYGYPINSYQCVICGKIIHPDNYFSWGDSINRNKHCVILLSKDQVDEDGFSYEESGGYKKSQILSIILEILKHKKGDEEIDLIDEFRKLKFSNCKIRDDKPILEYYILIIGGSNHECIGENAYVYTPTYMPAVNFLKYFKNLLNVKIEFIASGDILSGYECTEIRNENNSEIKFSKYNTLEELNYLLKISSKIPYKMVIDISNLSTYEIVNNKIVMKKYNLNLNEKFTNSYIVEIIDIYSIKNISTFENFFESYRTPNKLYLCDNGENRDTYYYSIEKDEIINENLDTTCGKIKSKLKNE